MWRLVVIGFDGRQNEFYESEDRFILSVLGNSLVKGHQAFSCILYDDVNRAVMQFVA